MTIDERLEALTQSVELLLHANHDNEARLTAMREENDRRFAEVGRDFAEIGRRFAEIGRLFAETHDFINRLAHIAEAHEQRLEGLEKP
jgi:hypothetical protein